MSDTVVQVRWQDGLRFEAEGKAGVPITVDGETEAGPSPMESLLIGLASCMGVDVVEILSKMRVPFDALAVRVEGDRREDPPRRYSALRLIYRVSGVPDGSEAKLQRAVDLSRNTYCSVLHTLRPDVDIDVRIETD